MDDTIEFELHLPDVVAVPRHWLEFGLIALSGACGYFLTLAVGPIAALAVITLFWLFEVAIPSIARL